MKRAISILAGVALLALGGLAQAGEPVPLTEGQMDQVTGGGTALALSGAATLGDVISSTISDAVAITSPGLASATATSTGIAASVFFNAEAVSQSQAAASL